VKFQFFATRNLGSRYILGAKKGNAEIIREARANTDGLPRNGMVSGD